MNRHFKWDKKYLYWGITAFCVVACAILFYMALNYMPGVLSAIGSLFSILSPFIWGLAITYILLPLVKSLQRGVFGALGKAIHKKKPEKAQRFARAMSVLLSEIIFLAIIVAIVYLIIPQLVSSITTIVENSSTYIANTTTWIEQLLSDNPEIEKYVLDVFNNVSEDLKNWLTNTVLPGIGNIAASVTTGIISVVKAVYNLVIGIIVSIYILGNIEGFSASAKKLMYTVFSVEAAEKLREGLNFTDKTFMGFINGKLLDSAIIGLICYIGCALLNIPYALLVSVIVGVTNVIPFFGPFIGAVPSALLILLVDPLKCLIFVIFIIVLQQLDGNVIGPKILGNSTGLSSFWVMFAILIFGGLFGFVGMAIGVPLFAVIYSIVSECINHLLHNRGLSEDTNDYRGDKRLDAETREFVHAETTVPPVSARERRAAARAKEQQKNESKTENG